MTKSYHAPRQSQLKSMRKRLFLWGGLIAVVFSVGLAIGIFRNTDAPQETPVVVESDTLEPRDIVLYFASADGQTLVAESRRINDCQAEDDCLRDTLQQLISGSQDGLVPVIPPQVTVRSVSVDGSQVSIDFSQDIVSAHPGGTQSELMTIYALADTMTVNFPHLKQVQILVEGAPAETLKGHVDLRQPIYPDFSLVEEGLVPIGNVNEEKVDKEE